ncbi:MerR family transcriptional regulator [Photobacterium sp. R1]
MFISEVAQKTNLSIHTLRYYEKEGLLRSIHRNPAGQRIYQASDLEWLAWIQRLKSTGMPLADIKVFAALRQQGDCSLKDRQELLAKHAVSLKREIERLNQELAIVEYKVDAYEEKLLALE